MRNDSRHRSVTVADDLWHSCQAITDIPCIAFVDELVAAYPNAKVVLTNRDVDSWLVSMDKSFYTVLEWPTLPILAAVDQVR